MASTLAPTLLNLPLEIRSKILGMLLIRKTCILITFLGPGRYDADDERRYLSYNEHTRPAPRPHQVDYWTSNSFGQVLCVNKQLNTEGSPIYYGKNTFLCESWGWAHPTRSTLPKLHKFVEVANHHISLIRSLFIRGVVSFAAESIEDGQGLFLDRELSTDMVEIASTIKAGFYGVTNISISFAGPYFSHPRLAHQEDDREEYASYLIADLFHRFKDSASCSYNSEMFDALSALLDTSNLREIYIEEKWFAPNMLLLSQALTNTSDPKRDSLDGSVPLKSSKDFVHHHLLEASGNFLKSEYLGYEVDTINADVLLIAKMCCDDDVCGVLEEFHTEYAKLSAHDSHTPAPDSVLHWGKTFALEFQSIPDRDMMIGVKIKNLVEKRNRVEHTFTLVAPEQPYLRLIIREHEWDISDFPFSTLSSPDLVRETQS